MGFQVTGRRLGGLEVTSACVSLSRASLDTKAMVPARVAGSLARMAMPIGL